MYVQMQMVWVYAALILSTSFVVTKMIMENLITRENVYIYCNEIAT